MSILTWILISIWFLILLMGIGILWIGTQPGHRRRGQNKDYAGPDRRNNTESVDLTNLPVLSIKDLENRKIKAFRICKDCPYSQNNLAEDTQCELKMPTKDSNS